MKLLLMRLMAIRVTFGPFYEGEITIWSVLPQTEKEKKCACFEVIRCRNNRWVKFSSQRIHRLGVVIETCITLR